MGLRPNPVSKLVSESKEQIRNSGSVAGKRVRFLERTVVIFRGYLKVKENEQSLRLN